MKINLKNRSKIVMAVIALTGVIRAETLTLNVADTSATNTLASALAGIGRTVADINGGEYAAFDLVKTGDGVLLANENLADFSGNITISGGRLIAAAANALGNATGVTRVENGASLVCDNQTYNLNLRTCGKAILEGGTGYPGEGGQLVSVVGSRSTYGVRDIMPIEIQLEGDATWAFRFTGNTFVIWEKAYLASVDVGSHFLTLLDPNAPKTIYNKNILYAYGTAFTASEVGGIVCDGLRLYLSYNGENYSTFSGPGTFKFRNCGYALPYNNAFGVDWTYRTINEYDDGSTSYVYVTPHDRSRSGEPVFFESFLSGEMNLATNLYFGWRYPYGTASRTEPYACMSFRGKVTGPGCFRPQTLNSDNFDGYGVSLTHDENDFTGGFVGLRHSWVALGGIRAAGTGKMQLQDSTLQFFCTEKSNGVYRLPAAEFSGSMLIRADGAKNGFAATSLALAADSVVTANASVVHADALALGAGSKLILRNPSADAASFRRAFAGLYVGGRNTPDNINSIRLTSIASAPFRDCVTNSVSRVPAPFNAPKSEWPFLATPETAYQTASGYLWNDADHDVEWTFCCTLCALWELTVGDNATVGNATLNSTGMSPRIVNLTLKPGANRFTFRMGNAYGSKFAGFTATNGLTNWTETYGLVFDPQGRKSTDGGDYTAFSADESLPLFTTVAEAPATDYAFGTISGSGTIDLNGASLTATNVAGTVTVTNGSLVVSVADEQAGVNLGSQSGKLVSEAYYAARAAASGLWTGTNKPSSSLYGLSTFLNHEYHDDIYTNSVVLSPEKFYLTYTETYDRRATYVQAFNTYDGYIWNNTSSPVSWKLRHTLFDYVELYVGDASLVATELASIKLENNNRTSISLDVTLQPGPNRFTVRTYDRFGSSKGYVHGNICTNDLSNWTDAFGLAYTTKADSLDKADYAALVDKGDGLLFTRSVPENPSGGSVTGDAGSAADLGHFDWTFGAVSGPIAFTNGDLTVSGTLTAAAEDIAGGCYLTTADALTFSADSAFVLTGGTLPRAESYVLAEAKSISGVPTPSAALAKKWNVVVRTIGGRAVLRLERVHRGLVLTIR